MRQQDNSLISRGTFRQHVFQDGLPLPFVRNPRDRSSSRNKAPLLSTYPFSNGVDGIASMVEPNAPSVKTAQCAEASPDRGWRKFGASDVGNVISPGFVS